MKRLVPVVLRSISGSSHVRYAPIWPVRPYTASVNSSSAGPPFCALYLMPKSFSGPPGLCEAVSRMPPYATPPSRSRMTAEAAGVESRPSRPTHTRETPLAAAMRQIVWIACRLWYRPSPDTTSVLPRSSSAGSASKMLCTKFSR